MTGDTAQQPRVAAPSDAFGFGDNWQRYVAEHLTPERTRIARESLRDLVGVDLAGQYLLDIGCGSGLFSLGAHDLGAARVVSVDVDPSSVASTRNLRERAGSPESWTVVPGSILDPLLIDELDPADVVYSWGVLHHTGDMWTAIRNAAKLVKPGGLFVIAIYNDARGKRFINAERWLTIKRAYNRSPRLGKRAMELLYTGWFAADELRGGKNPRTVIREYRHSRGMAYKTDVVDWLGGYPYEFASADEIAGFCEKSCGLETVRIERVSDTNLANNEFVFRRPASPQPR